MNFAQMDRLPNTSSVTLSLPGRHHNASARELLALCSGFVASAGSACHAHLDTPAPALLASGLTADAARRTMRFSWGADTKETEVEAVVAELAALCS